jgi:hypothetical protein
MKKQIRKKNLFRKTFESGKEIVKNTLLAGAFSLGMAACGGRPPLNVYGPDAGVRNDADVALFDVRRPNQDSKPPAQDSGPTPDMGADTLSPDMSADTLSPDTYSPQPDIGSDTLSPDSYVQTDSGVPPATYSYTVNNLIGDFLNREVQDRNNGLKEYSILTSETSPNANPFTDGAGGSLGVSEEEMHRISGSQFQPFATVSLFDNSSAFTYFEQQDLWIKGRSRYSSTEDDVVGNLDFLAYTLKFSNTGAQLGIPVCTTPTNSTDYSTCSDDYKTATNQLQLKFLGEDWVIIGMYPPVAALSNETALVAGGEAKLGKEAVSGIILVGESLAIGSYKIQLDDVEAPNNVVSAIISVLDANGNVFKKDKVTPGTTKEFAIAGQLINVHIWKAAFGATLNSRWAHVSILSHIVDLRNAQKVNPDQGNNNYWRAFLGWKNKLASVTDTKPDHLRTIILHAFDPGSLSTGGTPELQVGDSLPILQDPEKLSVQYLGLTSTNYNTLRFQQETAQYSISSTNGPNYQACIIHAPYVKVLSSSTGAVFSPDHLVSATDNSFLVATNGGSCNGVAFIPGALFIKESPSSNNWKLFPYVSPEMMVNFPQAGDGTSSWDSGGAIVYSNVLDLYTSASAIQQSGLIQGSHGNLPSQSFIFGLSQKAGVGVSSNSSAKSFFAFATSGKNTASDFNVDVIDGFNVLFKKDEATYKYTGPVDTGFTTIEEGTYTERGSQFTQMTSTLVEFKIADTLVSTQFRLVTK